MPSGGRTFETRMGQTPVGRVLALAGIFSLLGRAASSQATLPPQYSLWLVPSGAQYDSLQRVSCDLARRYAAHCSMPHMTVVGDVVGSLEDVGRRAHALALRTRPLMVDLTTIGWVPGVFFRSFYVLVNETAEVSALYDATCATVGKCQTRPFHMSLMYTDRLSDSARAVIRDSLYAGGDRTSLAIRVRLDRLMVCSSAGRPPEEWACPIAIELR